MDMAVIDIAQEKLILDTQKAIYWPKNKSLFIADLHLGKINHFRKAGIALPPQAAEQNISNLASLIQKYDVQKVIFLGDLFHSYKNDEWNSFVHFLETYPQIEYILVQGNHDIFPSQEYEKAKLILVDELRIGPFLCTHYPLESIQDGEYNLCGHIHPGVVLRGKGKQRLKLPCFYFKKNQGILPAFGTFTGSSAINSNGASCIYAIAGEELMKIEIQNANIVQ